MNFSDIILKQMQEKGLKISDLAAMTGFSHTYCADLLKGHRRWNEDTIEKFCKVFSLKQVFIHDKTKGE